MSVISQNIKESIEYHQNKCMSDKFIPSTNWINTDTTGSIIFNPNHSNNTLKEQLNSIYKEKYEFDPPWASLSFHSGIQGSDKVLIPLFEDF